MGLSIKLKAFPHSQQQINFDYSISEIKSNDYTKSQKVLL